MLLRKAFLICLALALLWAVVSVSLASYLANAAPQVALYLNRTEPTALLNRAGRLLSLTKDDKAVVPILDPASDTEVGANASSQVTVPNQVNAQATDKEDLTAASGPASRTGLDEPDVFAEVDQLASQALTHDPLNARALRMLGQTAHASGDEKRSNEMMQAAAERSLHESLALYLLVKKSYHDENYPAALWYADALLRTRTGMLPLLMPMLGRIAENSKASANLKHLLTKDSPWRSQFLSQLPKHITDARTPLEILIAATKSSTHLSERDLDSYLRMLVRNDFHDLAYYAWLQFLPPEQIAKAGYVFNGSFDNQPTPVPFDWSFKDGSGVIIERAMRPDNPNEFALRLGFGPGRAERGEVQQTLLLPPGDYRLSAEYKSDLSSQRGLKWSVTCAGTSKLVGESISVSGFDTSWKKLEFGFSIPDTDCSVQTLKLALDARSASERFVSGSILYDNLRIARDRNSEGPSE